MCKHGTAALPPGEAMDGAGRATQDAKAETAVLGVCREQKVRPFAPGSGTHASL